MAIADPQEMQAQIEVTNLKAMGDQALNLTAAFSAITIAASQNFAATMDALNKQLVSNLDFANKIMNTRLEIDPVEAAATSVILQQATKTAQTTPPVTP
jgi:oligoribonuclease (3'-5' exoribonuclease)